MTCGESRLSHEHDHWLINEFQTADDLLAQLTICSFYAKYYTRVSSCGYEVKELVSQPYGLELGSTACCLGQNVLYYSSKSTEALLVDWVERNGKVCRVYIPSVKKNKKQTNPEVVAHSKI